MQQPGLYFPFTHIRDDDWLKTAVLYWPSIRRLVPRAYEKNDSSTARTFSDAGILRDEEPGSLVYSMTWDLLETLKKNAAPLMQYYSVDRAFADWNGERWGGGAEHERVPQLGWIHATKFPSDVADYLSHIGLAQRGRTGRRDPWFGLHPVLADAYMTALVGRISEQARFEPLTDQADLRVATPSSDVQAAVNLLLGRAGADSEAAGSAGPGIDTYVMLALQYARPKNLANVPADKIVQCREDLQEDLQTFRNFVETQRYELADLATIPIQGRRLEAFAEHVEQTVEPPLRKLERSLKLLGLEPTRSLILTGSVAPPLAVGATLGAVGAAPFATAAGTLAAIGSAWWQVEAIRTRARADSPVGYLLDVRDRLTPKTLSARVSRVLRGTYGRN